MKPGGVVGVDAAGDLKVSAVPVATGRVDACFRDPLGKAHQVSWLEAAQDVVFEDCPVIRSFPVRYGRRVAPGWWWSSTSGRLVAYGSGVMRTQLMLLDRDPAVVALACRPVELVWREDGKVVSHAPQLMARLQDGRGLLLDCAGRIGASARLAERARVVAAAAEAVGWSYRLAGRRIRCWWPMCGGWPVTGIPGTPQDRGCQLWWRRSAVRGQRWRLCGSWVTRSPCGPRSFMRCGAVCFGCGWTNRCTSVPLSRSHGRRPERHDAGGCRSRGAPSLRRTGMDGRRAGRCLGHAGDR
ncbi:TnsA-like heteromeric transposase endonuclease subunit [Streptomyces sp. NPDC015346]|uniref:TnsA-like heteromeric transposase endonuclease subunit n=1 Tax=Streptomyces sp. NPDC015346 TaxID=3364954 RepID=UPI0037035689